MEIGAGSFDDAKALEAAGRFEDAAAAYDLLKSDPALTLRARRRRTECLMRLQRWPEAADEVAAVFDGCDAPLNRDLKRWLSIRVQLGEAAHPADPVTHYMETAGARGDYEPGSCTLMTAAAPKTGSTSLSVALAAAMSATKVNLLELPPTHAQWGVPWWPSLDAMKGYALVNHSHLSPDEETVRNIAARPWVKVAVHLRNPIETIESTIDMVIRQRSPNLLSGTPELAQSDSAHLRRWVMSHYLPRLSAWMDAWIHLVDEGHPWIVGLSTMDDMRQRGQDAVAYELLSGVDGVSVIKAHTEPQRTGNRLSGGDKIRLTQDEVDRVKAAVSPALLDRFGWA